VQTIQNEELKEEIFNKKNNIESKG